MISLIKLLTYFLLCEAVIALNVPAQRMPVTDRIYHARRNGLFWRNVSESFNSTQRTGSANHTNSTGTHHSCGDPFFDFTEENIKDSNFGEYYKDWSKTAHLRPDYNASNDEVAFFARQHIGWPNMKCGMSFGGCDNRPSCKDIIEYSKGDADKARRVYFTIESAHNMALYADNIYQAIIEAQSDLIMLIPVASKTFFFERDLERLAHCQQVKWAINTVVQVALMVSFLFVAPLLEGAFVAGTSAVAARKLYKAQKIERGLKDAKVGKELYDAKRAANVQWKNHPSKKNHLLAEKAEEKIAKHLEDVLQATADVATSEDTIKLVKEAESKGQQALLKKKAPWGRMIKTEKGWKFVDGRALKDIQAAALTVLYGEIGFPLTTKVEEDCMDQDPNDPDPSVVNAMEFNNLLSNLLRGYRKYISTSMSHMMEGSGYGEYGSFLGNESSFLSSMIADGNYLRGEEQGHRDDKANNPFELEQPIYQHLKGVMISEAWTANMCYMSCVDDFDRDCHNDVGEVSAMRFCPANGTICQAQCWQNSKKKARNIAPFGMDKLESEPWNFSKDAFMTDSWNNYMLNSLDKTHARPSIEDMLEDPTSTLKNAAGRPRGGDFTLPVCRSHYLSIRSYKMHGWSDGDKEQGVFPCTCGDMFSDETALFMNATKIIEWTGHEYVTKTCAKQLTKYSGMGPAEFFLAMCALGIRWPIQQHKQEEGSHPACLGVLSDARKTYEATFDLEAVNREFCMWSRVMTDGRFVETEHIRHRHRHGFGDVPTFEDMCKHFVHRSFKEKIGNYSLDAWQKTKDNAGDRKHDGDKLMKPSYDWFKEDPPPEHNNRTDVIIKDPPPENKNRTDVVIR